MLFLLGGTHGPLMRTVLGAAVLLIGLLLLRGWLFMAVVGAVLLVWGVIGLVSGLLARRQEALRRGRQEP